MILRPTFYILAKYILHINSAWLIICLHHIWGIKKDLWTASKDIKLIPRNPLFPQVIQNKWHDIHERLRVNHYFLSFFISSDIVNIKHVDSIVKVNDQTICYTLQRQAKRSGHHESCSFYKISLHVSLHMWNNMQLPQESIYDVANLIPQFSSRIYAIVVFDLWNMEIHLQSF